MRSGDAGGAGNQKMTLRKSAGLASLNVASILT